MPYNLVLIFVSALVFIKILQTNATLFGLIDKPNHRSMHKKHTPSSAGIGIYLSIFLALFIFNPKLFSTHSYLILGMSLVFLLGFIDDRYRVSAKTKVFVIGLSAYLATFDGFIIETLNHCCGVDITLGIFAIPFTIFCVTVFTNAFNLIDGIDGLAASLGIVILSAFLFIGYKYHDSIIIFFSLIFIVSLLAFLFYNWYPATIFMGDSGSLTLGFIISLLAIKSLAYIPAVSILFITAIPIFDTIFVMLWRKQRGRPIFSADSCHMHHNLKYFFKDDTKKTVIFLVFIQIINILIGLSFKKNMDEGFLLPLFVLDCIIFYVIFSKIRVESKKCNE